MEKQQKKKKKAETNLAISEQKCVFQTQKQKKNSPENTEDETKPEHLISFHFLPVFYRCTVTILESIRNQLDYNNDNVCMTVTYVHTLERGWTTAGQISNIFGAFCLLFFVFYELKKRTRPNIRRLSSAFAKPAIASVVLFSEMVQANPHNADDCVSYKKEKKGNQSCKLRKWPSSVEGTRANLVVPGWPTNCTWRPWLPWMTAYVKSVY